MTDQNRISPTQISKVDDVYLIEPAYLVIICKLPQPLTSSTLNMNVTVDKPNLVDRYLSLVGRQANPQRADDHK
jgi:hypothetical protein